MYIGRIVCVGRTADGRLCAAYRVSSRSFPNRTATISENKVSILPKAGFESDVFKNPYIAYNCARLVANGAVAVVTNGSHTDPVAEKIALGMPVRDALASVSLAMDFEKDQYDTPRISAVVDRRDDTAWLAIVRRDGIEVRAIQLAPGEYAHIATYEENTLSAPRGGFTPGSAEQACDFMLAGGIFKERTNPVTAVAALSMADGFALHEKDAPK
jgi:IMP cyclohydrolase